MVRVVFLHFVAFFVHFDKLIRRPPGPLGEGGGGGGGVEVILDKIQKNSYFFRESVPKV